jgi:hypothetical protein
VIRCDEKSPWDGPVGLAPLPGRWAKETGAGPLPWYAEMKRAEGTFATLLGLAFRRQPEAAEPDFWRAVAVGDSCLFNDDVTLLVAGYPAEPPPHKE